MGRMVLYHRTDVNSLKVFEGVVDYEQIQLIRHSIYEYFYKSRTERNNTKRLLFSLDEYPRQHIKSGKTDPKFQSWIECVLNLKNDENFHRLYEKLFSNSEIIQFLKDNNFGDFGYCDDYVLTRVVDPFEENSPLEFHQDAVFLRGISDPSDFLNFWINLDPIDTLRPEIEFLTGDYGPNIFPTRTSKMHSIFADLHSYSDNLFQRYVPKMNVGDVVVFSPYLLHRSSVSQNHLLPRASIDFRIQRK